MSERSLKIRGGGVLEGGEYDVPINVFGSLKVNGDLICKSIDCAGSILVNGDMEAEEYINVQGSIVADDMESRGDIRINGGAKINGDITSEAEVEINGGVQIEGDLNCGKLKLKGGAVIQGDMNVRDDCEINGGIRVNGDVRVDGDMIIKLSGHGDSEIDGSIEAGNDLIVTREKGDARLIAKDDISANGLIKLEHTEVVGNLKAREIYLGSEVVVRGNIYYIENIERSNEAKVYGEIIKIT